MDKYLQKWLSIRSPEEFKALMNRLTRTLPISSIFDMERKTHLGPKCEFAGATVHVSSRNDNEIRVIFNEAAWSYATARHAEALIFGIFDVLLSQEPALIGFDLAIQDINDHPIDSTIATFVALGHDIGVAMLKAVAEERMQEKISTGTLETVKPAQMQLSNDAEVFAAAAATGRTYSQYSSSASRSPMVELAPLLEQGLRMRIQLYVAEQTGETFTNPEAAQRAATALALIDDQQVLGAQEILEDLLKSNALNKLELAKLHNLLGICKLFQENYDEAARAFETSIGLERTPAALANASQAALLLDDPKNAWELVSEAFSLRQSIKILAIYMLVAQACGRRVELAKQLWAKRAEVKLSEDCLLALGQLAFDKRHIEKARRYYVNALRLNDANAQANFQMSKTIMVPLLESFRGNPPIYGRLSRLDLQKVQKAETHLSKAIETLKTTDLHKNLSRALAFRGALKTMQWRTQEAEKDLRSAIDTDSDNTNARLNLGRVFIVGDSWQNAIDILLPLAGKSLEADLFLGESYFRMQRLDKAVEYLERGCTTDQHTSLYYQSFDRLLEAHHKLGHKQDVNRQKEQVSQLSKAEPEAIYVLAKQARREGDFATAIAFYQLAASTIQGTMSHWVRREMAQYQFDEAIEKGRRNDMTGSIRLFQEAAQSIRPLVGQEDTPELREYIVALANGRKLERAAKLARVLRLRYGEAIPTISQIEASHAVLTKDWGTAAEILRSLCIIEPNQPAHRFNLAHALAMQGQLEQARAALGDLEISNELMANPDIAGLWALLHP